MFLTVSKGGRSGELYFDIPGRTLYIVDLPTSVYFQVRTDGVWLALSEAPPNWDWKWDDHSMHDEVLLEGFLSEKW